MTVGSPTAPQPQFPSGAAYAEALQHTQLCFRHPELRGARPDLTKLGLPRAISGAFASVFSLTSATSGQRYAVKCFTRYVPDQERRYQAISARLARLDQAELSQPWNLGFEYLPDAISVGQQRYPVLKMEWIEAVTLSSWLDDNHADRFAVDRLADRFAALTRDLSQHEIAHGDLQHGNLLVAGDDTLRLVDYDGMYVPDLAGLGGTERGHRNYQSPLRGNDDFGVELDRFSAWVIFMSLKAIAADPTLWNRLHQPSGEFLLLTEEDFSSPGGSTGLQTLLSHPDQVVSGLADRVRSLAFQPLELLPPLSDAIPKQRTAPTASTTSTGPAAVPSGSARGLPGWMMGHVPPQAGPTPTSAPNTSPDGFRGRTALDVVTALLWPLLLAMAGVLLMAGLPLPTAVAGAPVAAALLLTALTRSRRVERAQARDALAGLTQQLGRLDDPVKAAEKLRKEKEKFEAAESKRGAAYPKEQDKLTARYHAELKEAEQRRVRKQRDIDKKIDGLTEELRKALTKALTDKQNAYVRDRLGRRLIADSPPHGIGPTLAARLAAAGIRSAADFTGYRTVQNNSFNSTGAVLVLSNGRLVNVSGIGEAKAIALDVWRSEVVASAVARQPKALGSAERQQIEQGVARRRAQLTDQRKAIEPATEALRAKARKQLDDGQSRLSREHTLAGEQAGRQRQEFSRRTVALQHNSALHSGLSASVDAVRGRRRGLSYARYVQFLYTGR
ncbi:phosphotransferase [Streptomyces luridiscabiei]|uniref:phosphotransferase n=1 Tax=Streptomyces luridiscabiei TaxID=164114 RepID=UPI00099EDF73|nr:phosphotransferase [Streptomyces luridiscabiei]